jgi:hypothetical protein
MEKLTVTQAAQRAGITPGAWRSYVTRGRAPKPDGQHDGRTPWWWDSTVDQWRTNRPGRGRRTDLRRPAN